MTAPKTQPQPAAVLPDPPAGGRYKRAADGSLQQLAVTEPAAGRTPQSQAALTQRMAADAQPTQE